MQWQEYKNGNWIDIPGATRNTLAKDFPSTTLPGIYDYRLTALKQAIWESPLAKLRLPSFPLLSIQFL